MIFRTVLKIMGWERKILENRLLRTQGVKEKFAPGLKDTIYHISYSLFVLSELFSGYFLTRWTTSGINLSLTVLSSAKRIRFCC